MRNLKIYRKIVVFSLLIATMPLLVLGVLFFLRTRQMIEDELVSSYRSIVNVHMANLRNKSEAYHQLAESLMTNEALSRVLVNGGPLDNAFVIAGRNLDQELRRLAAVRTQNELYLISIYSDNQLAAIVSDLIVPFTHVEEAARNELQRIRDQATSPVYDARRTAGLRRSVVSIHAPFLGHDTSTFLSRKAVVQINVLTDEFLNNAIPTTPEQSEYGTYVFSETGSPVLTRPAHEMNLATDLVWEVVSGSVPESPTSVAVALVRQGFVLVPAQRALSLRYAFVFPLREFREKLLAVAIELAVLYLVLGFGLVMIAVHLAKPYKQRIARLIEKIGAVKQGDLRDAEPIGGNDEIGLVDAHLSEMVLQLRELLSTVYEEELQLKEAQLTALEAQMNPHFLFNALELINSIAAVHANHEVCTITEHLGRMLRYSLDSRSSHSATLEQEISNLQDYVAIHSYRFEGSVSVQLDVDERSMKALVPRFCLQPLVENCVIHGFSGLKSGGVISVRTQTDDGMMRIEVADNGRGIGPDTLQRLRSLMQESRAERHLHPKRFGRIGLNNVFARLVLTHGDAFSMTIDTNEQNGTTVVIVMPLHREELKHVQPVDR